MRLDSFREKEIAMVVILSIAAVSIVAFFTALMMFKEM